MTVRRWTLAVALALSPVPLLAEEATPKLAHGAGFGGENVCKAEEGGRIGCWNCGSDGTCAPAEFLADGELFRYPLSRKPGATAPELRMTRKRLDADPVRVSREKKDGDAWTESFAVVCTRVRS